MRWVLGPLVALAMGAAFPPALHAQAVTGSVRNVIVARGDTLRSLASRSGVDPRTIASDNGITPDAKLSTGMILRIDNRHVLPRLPPGVTLVVNVPQRMLFVNGEAGTAAYPVAVGRAGWQTPLGPFSVATKEVNPTWDVPESIRDEARRAGRSLPLKVPPGPANPLGAYWLGLSVGGVGIHGTNAPLSIYQTVTHGCIRMHPDDVAALFTQVQVGTSGELTYQPILMAVENNEVFLEVHRDVYGRGPHDRLEFVKGLARELGASARVDWDTVAKVLDERAGVARSVARR